MLITLLLIITPTLIVQGLWTQIQIPSCLRLGPDLLDSVGLFGKARGCPSFVMTCRNTLRTIDGAKQTWSLENRKSPADVPSDDDLFGVMLYVRTKPVCPAGGKYSLNAVNQKPACSFPGHTI
jgi:hypothetical protein